MGEREPWSALPSPKKQGNFLSGDGKEVGPVGAWSAKEPRGRAQQAVHNEVSSKSFKQLLYNQLCTQGSLLPILKNKSHLLPPHGLTQPPPNNTQRAVIIQPLFLRSVGLSVCSDGELAGWATCQLCVPCRARRSGCSPEVAHQKLTEWLSFRQLHLSSTSASRELEG